MSDLRFSGIAIDRRYGDRLYLSGQLHGIVESDEICVMWLCHTDDVRYNLASDDMDYLHFSGSSGSYDFKASGSYILFDHEGVYKLRVYDVEGQCENIVDVRLSHLMRLWYPRFQYQVIFDLSDPDLGDQAWRLEAEYAKYAAADSWFVTHRDPDCFTYIQPSGSGIDDTPAHGWLSLAVEFGRSSCYPLPHWLCPFPSPETRYWRGECSCRLFRTTLHSFGIPCQHLIAAMKHYSGDPAWSTYVQCP